ncbi:MAG: ATP-dependent 6-phosphofructokinase [Deltaproteobacteria bacterium]|nr:ATP-dependent 6-phosphofructokinase [Deltaproteobacteria bacterium]
MDNIKLKKIAVCTGGGDAPGLNAVIRAVVLSCIRRGIECYGIRDGFNGILSPESYPQGGVVLLGHPNVKGITQLGGTILGTTNRGNPLHYPIQKADGTIVETDRSGEILQFFKQNEIAALISIGGDGSLLIAHELAQKGLKIIGIPKTIDNDLEQTVVTFGFDTAVSFATECLDRLHSTAESHHRIMVVEVMGRYAGWIALNSGIAGVADAVLIPEIPYQLEKVVEKISSLEKRGRTYAVIVVAEGAKPVDGEVTVLAKEIGRKERLGGVGEKVAKELSQMTGQETRVVVLGHLLRGGKPTCFDRLIALRFGAAAVRALEEGYSDVMVALESPAVKYVPLVSAIRRMKSVPLTCDTILTGRDLGVCFGD